MYNFKKNAKLYIVEGSNKHSIEVYADLSASQTFDEQGYRLKTLHSLNDLHDGATIVRASPANFQFTTPIFDTDTIPIALTLGSSYSNGTVPNFDIYLESDNIIYKIQKAVIETSTFNVSMDSILTVSISGSASKLSVFTDTVPGTPVISTNRQYVRPTGLTSSIGGVQLDTIASVNIEIANEVSWTPNNTLHESLSGALIYPASYTVGSRRVSGSLTQFLTSENVDSLSDTSTSSAIVVDVLTSIGQSVPFLRFNLPSSVFTRRINMDELFNRVYDFRLNSNSINVKPIYKGV